jgi:hypothetical protein
MKMKTEAIYWKKIFANQNEIKGLYTEQTNGSIIKKKKTLQLKTGKRSKFSFHQRKFMDSKQAHEKVLNIVSY